MKDNNKSKSIKLLRTCLKHHEEMSKFPRFTPGMMDPALFTCPEELFRIQCTIRIDGHIYRYQSTISINGDHTRYKGHFSIDGSRVSPQAISEAISSKLINYGKED